MELEDERVERPPKWVQMLYAVGSADVWTKQTWMARRVNDAYCRAHRGVLVRFRLPAHEPADEPVVSRTVERWMTDGRMNSSAPYFLRVSVPVLSVVD